MAEEGGKGQLMSLKKLLPKFKYTKQWLKLIFSWRDKHNKQ